MNAEQLKVIAEGMGYKEIAIIAGYWLIVEKDDYKGAFDPFTNNDQNTELHKLLMEQGYWVYQCPITKTYHITNEDSDCSYGKNFNEAVCSWSFEHFK